MDKAAALFHSLVTNHAFENGNKRTAVVTADQFLLANGYFLAMTQAQIYQLAIETATHNQRNILAEQMLNELKRKFRSSAALISRIAGNRELDELRVRLKDGRKDARNALRIIIE